MGQSLCAVTVSAPEVWDNRSEAAPGGNPTRPLTHSSDFTREGLAMKATQVCSIEGCERVARERGMCHACYERLRTRGEIQLLPVLTVDQRLVAGLVRKPNGCLEWTGSTNTDGYGHLGVDGKTVDAHRLAWTLANGPIPPGMKILHRCDNPPCCETDPTERYPEGHLFLGTAADNAADKITKGRDHNQRKTQCPQGHFYDAANTYMTPKGGRSCRICNRAAVARLKARKVSS